MVILQIISLYRAKFILIERMRAEVMNGYGGAGGGVGLWDKKNVLFLLFSARRLWLVVSFSFCSE